MGQLKNNIVYRGFKSTNGITFNLESLNLTRDNDTLSYSKKYPREFEHCRLSYVGMLVLEIDKKPKNIKKKQKNNQRPKGISKFFKNYFRDTIKKS